MSSWDAMVEAMRKAKGEEPEVPLSPEEDEEEKLRQAKLFHRIKNLLGYGSIPEEG